MKNRPLHHKLGFALRGVGHAWRQEDNFRRHVWIALLTLALFGVLQPSAVWWALVVLCIGLVLALELANSALEALIDHLHPELHDTIGRIKDMLAAMVLVLAITAGVVGVLAILDTV